MNKYMFGFIGVGNMGSALSKAVCKAVNPKEVMLSNRTIYKAQKLADKLSATVGTNTDIAKYAKYIFLGVKPQMLKDLADSIMPVLKERKDEFYIVSMAAGVEIATLSDMFDKNFNIIRIMPNTPVECGKGIILYCSNKNVPEEFTNALKYAGIVDKIDENIIDAASAVSGCGPAFCYMFLDALADGGVKCGLPREKALLYAEHTLIGSAELLIESNEHPDKLKNDVCSPGGSTIDGVLHLERNSFRGNVSDAVINSFKKTKELGK